MEISVIDSGINRFQKPDFLTQHLKTPWIWAALILAAIATFNSLIARSKLIIFRFHKNKSVALQQSYCAYSSDHEDDDDVSCSSFSDDEDNDDVSCSSSSPSDDDGDEEKEKNFGDFEGVIQGGNGKYDHHFNWPCDGSVVKLWDEMPAVQAEAVVSGGAGRLKVWDARDDGEACVSAKWQSERIGRMARIRIGRSNEVYIEDDWGKLTVVDLRNVSAPLAERWWSDDTVTVGEGNWIALT